MKTEIKEQIKEGCGKEFIFYNNDATCGEDFEYEGEVKVILCPKCKAQLKGYEQAEKEKVSDFSEEGIKNWICLQENPDVIREIIKFSYRKLKAIGEL